MKSIPFHSNTFRDYLKNVNGCVYKTSFSFNKQIQTYKDVLTKHKHFANIKKCLTLENILFKLGLV